MDSFKVKIKIGTGEMELSVTSSTKVSELKRMIQGRANVAFIKKKIVYEGTQLSDEMTLSELGVQSGSTISVENI